jgi:hypothetical protein
MNEGDGQIFSKDGMSARQWLQGVARWGASSTFIAKWSKLVGMGLLEGVRQHTARSRVASIWRFETQPLRAPYYRPAVLALRPASRC